MPRLESRGNAVVIKDNQDRSVAYFPPSVGEIAVSPYGDSLIEQRALAEGLVAETASRLSAVGTSGTSTGVGRLAGLYLRRGMVLTNGWVVVSTNGTGVTLAKIGLWRPSDGALVAGSSDQSANINAGTAGRAQNFPLTPAYTVPADGFFYAGILQVGTTPAVIVVTGNQSVAALPGFPAPHAALSGQSDLAGYTPPLGSSAVAPWIGFS
jgi:hypothetical protein